MVRKKRGPGNGEGGREGCFLIKRISRGSWFGVKQGARRGDERERAGMRTETFPLSAYTDRFLRPLPPAAKATDLVAFRIFPPRLSLSKAPLSSLRSPDILSPIARPQRLVRAPIVLVSEMPDRALF